MVTLCVLWLQEVDQLLQNLTTMAEEIKARKRRNRCARVCVCACVGSPTILHVLVHTPPWFVRRRSGDLPVGEQHHAVEVLPEIPDSHYVEPHKVLAKDGNVNTQRAFKVRFRVLAGLCVPINRGLRW